MFSEIKYTFDLSIIQENIVSFEKFYSFLNKIGKVTNNELTEMKVLMKNEKSDWIEELEKYWDNIKNYR